MQRCAAGSLTTAHTGPFSVTHALSSCSLAGASASSLSSCPFSLRLSPPLESADPSSPKTTLLPPLVWHLTRALGSQILVLAGGVQSLFGARSNLVRTGSRRAAGLGELAGLMHALGFSVDAGHLAHREQRGTAVSRSKVQRRTLKHEADFLSLAHAELSSPS